MRDTALARQGSIFFLGFLIELSAASQNVSVLRCPRVPSLTDVVASFAIA
jgi:hypothetical protein